MNTVMGLFENLNHVDSVIYALKQAGIEDSNIRRLSKEYITKEADMATRYTRAGRLSGIFGIIAGGYLGMAAIAAGSELFGYLTGTTLNILGIVLILFVGAVAGALIGAFIGARVVAVLLERFGILDESSLSAEGHLNRDGFLVAVDTDGTNLSLIEKIMRNKEVISIEVQHEVAPTLSPAAI